MADHITVTGTGQASATPDRVAAQVSIVCESESVADALATCADRVAATLDAASELGISPADRQTTTIAVQQQYDREGRTVVGYTVVQGLRIRVRDPQLVGALLTSFATAAGDTLRVDGVFLELSDIAELERLAREAAFEQARIRAEHYASLAGRRLGRVRELVEGSPVAGPMPRMARMAMEVTAAGMPVEVGESSVSRSITATWALTKPDPA